nr:immunoglobulin heavy chain junction region [Mus musculus]
CARSQLYYFDYW